MFWRKKGAEDDSTQSQALVVTKAETQRLTTENEALKQRNEVLEKVLNLLPETWVFLIEDIQTGTIVLSNATGKELVKKSTRVAIQDGKTSIHQFHKTPDRSKWVLSKMPEGWHNANTTIQIGNVVIKSTSHKFTVWGQTYYLGIFSDWTSQANEIKKVDLMRSQTEQLLRIFVMYSWLCADFSIMSNDLEKAKHWIHWNKQEINNILIRITERFKADINMFDRVSASNQETADIFKSLWLIALNWSIEAAHAGDAGRGFWVVANETRKIASASQEVLNGSVKFLQEWVTSAKTEIGIINAKVAETLEDNTIESLVDKRVEESNHVLTTLVKNIAGSAGQIKDLIWTFKWFYTEKFTGKEQIRKMLLATKLDHLLFVIRLNNLIVTGEKNEKFADHTACDLGKFLYSDEIRTYVEWNHIYEQLLQTHEMFHTVAWEIAKKLQKKDKTAQDLEEANIVIRGELLSCVNMTIHLLNQLSENL